MRASLPSIAVLLLVVATATQAATEPSGGWSRSPSQATLVPEAPPTLTPPFVGLIPVAVDYSGGEPGFTITATVSNGHANSRCISLTGDWITPDTFDTTLVPAIYDRVFVAVWIWGTSFPTTTVRIELDDQNGVTASADVAVSVSGSAISYPLAPNSIVVGNQGELDALIASGGTMNQLYLRGGFYRAVTTVVNSIPRIETHPDDWFQGVPAVLAGPGGHGAGGNQHRLWGTTADDIILRRLFFHDTYWTTFHIQDVDAPRVDNIIQWEVYVNGTLDNTTNGIVEDVHTIGAWDSGTKGENANALVVTNTGAASNNRVERCIALGISDDGFDGWRSQDTTWANIFAAFCGKDADGDGAGIKLNGSSAAGGNLVRNAYFYDTLFAVNSNSSTPVAPSRYHNITPVDSRDRDYFFDGSIGLNADVRNCISLDDNNGQAYGAHDAKNTTWQLGISPTPETTLDAMQITWEGFEASGFGQIQSGDSGGLSWQAFAVPPGNGSIQSADPAIDSGTNARIDPATPIVNGTVDVGAFEFGRRLYREPVPPIGLTQAWLQLTGDLRPGGYLTVTCRLEAGDSVRVFYGSPPIRRIDTPALGGTLAILPSGMLFTTFGWPGDTSSRTLAIPDNPNLSGLSVLVQGQVRSSFGGPEDSIWTNCAVLKIE